MTLPVRLGKDGSMAEEMRTVADVRTRFRRLYAVLDAAGAGQRNALALARSIALAGRTAVGPCSWCRDPGGHDIDCPIAAAMRRYPEAA
jgi:hypothetical protein